MDNDNLSFLDRLLETDRIPEWLIRVGVRRLLAQRLDEENKGDTDRVAATLVIPVSQRPYRFVPSWER